MKTKSITDILFVSMICLMFIAFILMFPVFSSIVIMILCLIDQNLRIKTLEKELLNRKSLMNEKIYHEII